jgi:hypothetical protein
MSNTEAAIYWFGVLHLGAYAFASFMLASAWFIDWSLRRLKIKREVIRALAEYWKQKQKNGRIPG